MRPLLRGSIRFRAASVPFTVPRYVTSVTRRNSSGVISLTGEKTEVIALLTHTSMGPNSSSILRAARSTAPASETSVGTSRGLQQADARPALSEGHGGRLSYAGGGPGYDDYFRFSVLLVHEKSPFHKMVAVIRPTETRNDGAGSPSGANRSPGFRTLGPPCTSRAPRLERGTPSPGPLRP